MLLNRIVICGGGYAGIQTALELDRLLDIRDTITLVDKNSSHILLPSLPEAIIKRGFLQIPYNDIFAKRRIKFVQSEIQAINLQAKHVATTTGSINYDILIVALGGVPFLPDSIPGLKEHAYQFNSIEDIKKIMGRLAAIGDNDSIIVAGGGATGVEVAGEVASYLEIGKKKSQLHLVSTSLLADYPAKARTLAKSYLQSIGVSLKIGPEYRVLKVDSKSVLLQNGKEMKNDFIIWSGGIQASRIPKDNGLKVGDKDRVIVNQYLQSVDNQDVFVVGDCALILDNNGRPIATNAQFAEQQGKVAGYNVHAMLTGGQRKKYRPEFQGFAVSIGPTFAVGSFGDLDLYGSTASNLKKLIKLKYLREIVGVSAAVKDYASSRF